MLELTVGRRDRTIRLLCIGAHSDDLEIGCGGTLLKWLSLYPSVEVTWAVLCASAAREAEARDSARALLRRAKRVRLVLRDFPDGRLPARFSEAKDLLQELKADVTPDVVLTHRLEDRHQDHRMLAELTWQTFRNHLVLEYEIPKYEGDLGLPNLYVALPKSLARRKVAHLMRHFGTQRSKSWFRPETFYGLLQLRGIECRAGSGFAEALYARKLCL